jgi:hypothetical protein
VNRQGLLLLSQQGLEKVTLYFGGMEWRFGNWSAEMSRLAQAYHVALSQGGAAMNIIRQMDRETQESIGLKSDAAPIFDGFYTQKANEAHGNGIVYSILGAKSAVILIKLDHPDIAAALREMKGMRRATTSADFPEYEMYVIKVPGATEGGAGKPTLEGIKKDGIKSFLKRDRLLIFAAATLFWNADNMADIGRARLDDDLDVVVDEEFLVPAPQPSGGQPQRTPR